MILDSCEFTLIGGLGNQLFILAAAIEHQMNGYPVVLSAGNLKNYGNSHNNSIADLVFEGMPIEICENGSDLGTIRFKAISAISRSFGLTDFLNWKFEQIPATGDISHPKGNFKRHFGYFQNFTNLSTETKKILESIEPAKTSKEFLRIRDFMQSRQSLVVHIRRGDYLTLRNSFGVLSQQYYENYIEQFIREDRSLNCVVIFSDSFVDATHLAKNIKIDCIIVNSPDSKLTDSESLVLMKYGKSHIIANSTFSWWGAYLSSNTVRTISPKPWFRSDKLSVPSIPLDWERGASIWI